MRILVADDSRSMRAMICAALEQQGGHVVATAADGENALEAITRFRPELILLDWNMPRMNGAEFLEAYRRRRSKKPIILLVTELEQSILRKAPETGAAAMIVKPFTPDDLLRCVDGMQARLAA